MIYLWWEQELLHMQLENHWIREIHLYHCPPNAMSSEVDEPDVAMRSATCAGVRLRAKPISHWINVFCDENERKRGNDFISDVPEAGAGWQQFKCETSHDKRGTLSMQICGLRSIICCLTSIWIMYAANVSIGLVPVAGEREANQCAHFCVIRCEVVN